VNLHSFCNVSADWAATHSSYKTCNRYPAFQVMRGRWNECALLRLSRHIRARPGAKMARLMAAKHGRDSRWRTIRRRRELLVRDLCKVLRDI